MNRVPKESLHYDDGNMFLNDQPFTGVAYFNDDTGAVTGEIEYRDGLEWGRKWEAFEPGKLSFESHMFMGVLHGRKREWHYNGQLASDSFFELGFKISEKKWDEDGELVEDYELDPADEDSRELEKYREIYKNELERWRSEQ